MWYGKMTLVLHPSRLELSHSSHGAHQLSALMNQEWAGRSRSRRQFGQSLKYREMEISIFIALQASGDL